MLMEMHIKKPVTVLLVLSVTNINTKYLSLS